VGLLPLHLLLAHQGRCITIIDTIILTNYTNDAYTYDTYTATKDAHPTAFEERVTCNESLPISEGQVGVVEPYLAVGTSAGYLRLFPFPAAMEGAESHRYRVV
jgi:hypothetical protein